MGTAIDEPVLRFRSGFWPVWRVTMIWSSVTAAICVIVIGIALKLPITGIELVAAAAMAIVCGILVAAAVIAFPVYIRPDGLRCYDFFGNYRLAPWETIERAEPINLLGLRYLRVQAPPLARPLWLPLFLADMDGFVDAVYRLVGKDHPLVMALHQSRC